MIFTNNTNNTSEEAPADPIRDFHAGSGLTTQKIIIGVLKAGTLPGSWKVCLAYIVSHFLILECHAVKDVPIRISYLAKGRVNRWYNNRHKKCSGVQKKEP